MDRNKTNKKRLYQVIKLSSLEDFIDSLKDKIDTRVGSKVVLFLEANFKELVLQEHYTLNLKYFFG